MEETLSKIGEFIYKLLEAILTVVWQLIEAVIKFLNLLFGFDENGNKK